jgi:hypothetical protein
MIDAPTTFRSEPPEGGLVWSDYAELHRADDGGGVLSGLKALRHGTLAEMVRFVASLPETERAGYTILKGGDHLLHAGEIAGLARRADFPG